MSEPERPLTVTGVDGCAAGWVAVTLGSPVTGTAVTLTNRDQPADDGSEIAIRY